MPHGKSKVGKGGNRSHNHAVNVFTCKCGWSAQQKTTADNREVDNRERRLMRNSLFWLMAKSFLILYLFLI